MSRFAKFATGLRDFGNDINANISKALNISKASESPNDVLLEEARTGRVAGLEAALEEFGSAADVNDALDGSFLSPLCLACRGGHEEAALFLLRDAAADPNNAVGEMEAAAARVAAGATLGYPMSGADGADGSDSAGGGAPPTPLALAVASDLQVVVEELLARGARVDTRRAGDGWTVLHMCAARGNALMMEVLLAAPLADPGARTSSQETPLSVAAFHGHLSIVDMLLGDDGGDKEGKGAAAGAGAAAAAAAAADGGEVQSETAGGARTSTALVATDNVTSAAGGGGSGDSRGHRGSRRYAEGKTWAGLTPLHRAAAQGHTEVVLRLLAHGVDAAPADCSGATPLHLSAAKGRWGAARALVREGGASTRVVTAGGDTVLHAATWSAAVSGGTARGVVRLLLDFGAEVDARNRLGSTALHLAAAAADYHSVALLLSAGASPSAINSCGLSPGACFLRAPRGFATTGAGAGSGTMATSLHARETRRALREHRGRLGHLRRLADTSSKRVAIEAVADRATAAVHRYVEFALKMQRWDLDFRAQRTRLRRLDNYRSDILCDPDQTDAALPPATGTAGAAANPPLLLDLSPEREGRAQRVVKNRRKAAEEAVKGARLALRNLQDWKEEVVAERVSVVAFLDRADPALAFAAGPACDGRGSGGGGGMTMTVREVDVVVADPSFLAAERNVGGGGGGRNEDGRLRRHASWAGTGAETAPSKCSPPTPSSGSGGDETSVVEWRGGRTGSGPPAVGFLRALAALDPCVAALREARSAATTGDRLSLALETLREHVKATLIDLMDLETSIPGDAGVDLEDSDGFEENATAAAAGASPSAIRLSAADAGALDFKVAELVRRLSGGRVGSGGNRTRRRNSEDNGAAADGGGGEGGSGGGPASLAEVYEDGLRGAAGASEAEVDTTESLTAHALGMVTKALAGPMLWALDDAYQRLMKSAAELRRTLPDAEALVGGTGSAEELAHKARGRLVTVRQQVVDEQDLLAELVSKLGRRRRQAADADEIRSIEDERLQVRARLETLRSVKLAELKALRRSRAYERFPELLLEQPSPAESAFRALQLDGIAVRDVDEWGEHHLSSLASMESAGGGGGGGGGGSSSCGNGVEAVQGLGAGASERMLAGLGGQGCRLAEIDGTAVAIVEVDCRDRQAERALVAKLQRFAPLTNRRLIPAEVAEISGVSLQDGRAMLEAPVEGAITARAWLATSAAGVVPPTTIAMGGKGPATDLVVPAEIEERGPSVKGADGSSDASASSAVAASLVDDEQFQVQVWAVMVQALRGLVAVHALSKGSTHGAVCLSNILVAARARVSTGSPERVAASASLPPPVPPPVPTPAMRTLKRCGFRRSQLGPPAPGALAYPPAFCVAPEVARGQDFAQPADVYAFGCALRAACCGGGQKESFYAATGADGRDGKSAGGDGVGAGAGGRRTVLPPGLGPSYGPLREALVQLLEGMLEEDASRRCTALEALSSDYFRAPPLQFPNPMYPPSWSPFPARSRRVSSTAPGTRPHWVAVALTAGRIQGDASTPDRGWFDSTYAEEVPLATTVGAGVGGGRTHELESSRIESMLRRSLPGARLRRLVRLQDRGRMLRFTCERDAAMSSSAVAPPPAGSGGGGGGRIGRASVLRLFADPRDVVARDTLVAIMARDSDATANAAGGGGWAGQGWTAGPTSTAEVDSVGNSDNHEYYEGGSTPSSTGYRSATAGAARARTLRCTEAAQFAAVAFAPPPTETGGEAGEGHDGASNLRTLAIVSAIVGVPGEGVGTSGDAEARPEVGVGRGGAASSSCGSSSLTTGALTKWPLPSPPPSSSSSSSSPPLSSSTSAVAAAAGGEYVDPFSGMDHNNHMDDFTRAGGVDLASPPTASLAGGGGGGGGGEGSELKPAPGLSPPTVHSNMTLEAVDVGKGRVDGETALRPWCGAGAGAAGGGGGRDGGGDGQGTPVYTLRHDACYPEYLATFSL